MNNFVRRSTTPFDLGSAWIDFPASTINSRHGQRTVVSKVGLEEHITELETAPRLTDSKKVNKHVEDSLRSK